jgi:hypothetical protein
MAKVPMPRPVLSKPPPPKPATMHRVPTNQELAANQERQDKRDRAKMKVDIFQTDVGQRFLGWSNAVGMVGSAYKIADNSYREVLGKKTAKDALEIQIFFSVLTVATSGALGWLSYAAAQSSGGIESALRDAVESGIQATAGEVFSADSPLIFPPNADSTVSADPQVFQNEMQKKVNDIYKEVLLVFNQVRQRYLDVPLASWDTFDEDSGKEAFEKWQKKANELADEDDLPSVDWMAREIERGRWQKFVLDNHSYRDFGIFKTADSPDDVGDIVRSRLSKDLGVAPAAVELKNMGRNTYGEIQRTTRRLWEWAQHYEVRKFTDEKKHPKGGGPDHQ